MRRLLEFSAVLYLAFAAWLHLPDAPILTPAQAAVTCNPPSGFIQQYGAIYLGDLVQYGPCGHINDSGVAIDGNIPVPVPGATCDGVTDDGALIQAALNANPGATIMLPPRLCFSSVPITIPNGDTLATLNMIPGNPPQGGGIICGAAVSPCVQVGNTAAGANDLNTARLQNALVTRAGGEPLYASYTASQSGTTLSVSAVSLGTLAIGQTVICNGCIANEQITAFVSGSGGTGTYTVTGAATITSEHMSADFVGIELTGYNPVVVDVFSFNHSINFFLDAAANIGGGLGAMFTRFYGAQASDAQIVLDSWPEARFSQGRLGINATGNANSLVDYANDAFIRIRGASPNTLNFVNVQFNQTGNSEASAFWIQLRDCISVCNGGLFEFTNVHVETVSSAYINTPDNSWTKLNDIFVDSASFYSDEPFFTLNAATTVQNFNIVNSDLLVSTFSLTPTNAIVGLHVANSQISGGSCAITIHPGGTTSVVGFANNTFDCNVTLAGTYTALSMIGDNYVGGALTDTVAGNELNLDQLGNYNWLIGGNYFGIGTRTPRGPLEIAAPSPTSIITDTSETTDNKSFDWFDASGCLNGRAVNDAYSIGTVWIAACRSGNSITDVLFPNGYLGFGAVGLVRGNTCWFNATSGEICLEGPTGALGIVQLMLPDYGNDTLAGFTPAGGGTGINSPTAHSLLQSEGASAFNLITAATAGNIPIDQGAGSDWLSKTLSQDCTLASTGAITCTKTNNVAFGVYATATQGQLPGIASNTAASAGNIGELISAYCPNTASDTAGFTNSSAVITTTNTPPVGCVVNFTNSGGALPTNFAAGTNYFVVSIVAGVSIQVSATAGGSAIVAGSAGTGTQTVVFNAILTSAQATPLEYVSLTAGDWDCSAVGAYVGAAGTTNTTQKLTINTNAASTGVSGNSNTVQFNETFTTASIESIPVGPTQELLNSTTIIYLNSTPSFATSTALGYGQLRCRRTH